ncbi:type II toxin-antitoxin system PemK/MazF family toxin [Pedococcus sp. KACC 23699]|uniref:Type II toxin-antitoxin system PemK/MazF family toxin n=1 Tax=Pedococcus sp. KACC 23699 TaxID=3149228 RepID=A0AAU7JUA4_9MICO
MARRGLGAQLAQILGRAVRDGARSLGRGGARRAERPAARPSGERPDGGPGRTQKSTPPIPSGSYPGDFTGVPDLRYAANPDGRPDPGEIVWTWVPYEEDHGQGKDRPVLLVGRDGGWLLALMLTSKDHDRDAAQEARHGRRWQDIGSGDWDRQGRPSEVRLDRVIRVDPAAVRREGATLDRARFDLVAAGVRAAG